MTDYDKMKSLAAELKKLAMEKNVVIITAQQHPPLRPYGGRPKVDRGLDLIIVDYMDLLRPRR